MKLIAGIGILFFVYCLIQVLSTWSYRNAIEKALWFVFIAVGAGFCSWVVMR